MDLKGILSISGYPGLFKLVTHSRNGIIVESLKDKKRMQAFASSKISALEDIAIYTSNGEIPLHDVFKNIFDKYSDTAIADTKNLKSEEVKDLFSTVLPDYDTERVYVSDMKRVFTWYNILLDMNLVNFSEENVTETEVIETADLEKGE